MLCKKALEETDGDLEKAIAQLRKSSESMYDKKSSRTTGSGIVEAYVHGGGKVGVLLEIRCETDFVARNKEFKELAHDIALHIAGMSPAYVDKDQISEEAKAEAKRLFVIEAESLGKSKEMVEKIVLGKIEAHFSDISLMQQSYVKDPAMSIGELIKKAVSRFGENIEIVRFVRYEV